jgi:hypothetical protein
MFMLGLLVRFACIAAAMKTLDTPEGAARQSGIVFGNSGIKGRLKPAQQKRNKYLIKSDT